MDDLNGTDYEFLDGDEYEDYDGIVDDIDDSDLSDDAELDDDSDSLPSDDAVDLYYGDVSNSDEVFESGESGDEYEVDDGSQSSKSDRELSWNIGTLKAGESASLVLSTRALSTGSIIENVNVSTSTYESDLTNNNDSANVTVIEDEPPQEDPEDDGPVDEDDETPDFFFDYYVPKDNNDLAKKSDLKKASIKNPAKASKVKAVKKGINMKNTGNPLIVFALSIFCLFAVQSRRKN